MEVRREDCFLVDCSSVGLSPEIVTVDQIRVLNRFQELPTVGPIADLMWSDPDADNDGFNLSQRFVACPL